MITFIGHRIISTLMTFISSVRPFMDPDMTFLLSGMNFMEQMIYVPGTATGRNCIGYNFFLQGTLVNVSWQVSNLQLV